LLKINPISIKHGLPDIINAVNRILDVDVSIYDELFFAEAISRRLTETSIKTASAYLEYLSKNPAEAKLLADSCPFSRPLSLCFYYQDLCH
jgi:chemotaxis methyl-accepting protein methylase